MNILGISGFYHDSAATLLSNGSLIAAAQEERFSRHKHDHSFPSEATKFCLEQGNLKPEEIDYVIFYEKPFEKFDRILETTLGETPMGFESFEYGFHSWIKEKLFVKRLISSELEKKCGFHANVINKLLFSEHHLSHAASAFYPSPFTEAAILTVDGVGEWTTTSLAKGTGNQIEILFEQKFPHSLGLLYSAFTQYCGFKVNSGEYKLMGLAPYGEPRFFDLILENMIDLADDGSFHLNMDCFDFTRKVSMISKQFEKILGKPQRQFNDSEIDLFYMDVASSIQKVLELSMDRLVRFARRQTGSTNLCLAGGVALNCVANAKIRESKVFKNMWIQPAAGDAGGSLGASYACWHMYLNRERNPKSEDSMKGSYLGPCYKDKEIESQLRKVNAVFEQVDEESLYELAASFLAVGAVIGWMQGRMEFGPRALGNRSILADPRKADAQSRVNLKIKFRESFRPFAPAILEERVEEWFGEAIASPYMLETKSFEVNKRLYPATENIKGFDKLKYARSGVPAVTHVDYSARLQTVTQTRNPIFHRLLSEFFNLTGCPMLINTSFNVRGEPIVCTPEHAYHCFMETEMDVLIIGNYLLKKEQQPKSNQIERREFDFD